MLDKEAQVRCMLDKKADVRSKLTVELTTRASEVSYFWDFHVDAAVVLSDVEVEVLIVDAQVPALGQLALVPGTWRTTLHGNTLYLLQYNNSFTTVIPKLGRFSDLKALLLGTSWKVSKG